MFDSGFERHEFACSCGCGFDTVDIETLWVLEELKRWFRTKVTITSGCRCRKWNASVGGKKGSYHVLARAADIIVVGFDAFLVYEYLDKMYPDKYGIGKYTTFTHFDTRSGRARW